MKTRRLLIVDPEAMMAELLKLAFESDQCRILTATAAAAAIGMIEMEKPEVVLVNPSMPGGTGLIDECLRRGSCHVVALVSPGQLPQRKGLTTIEKGGRLADLVHAIRSHLALDILPSTRGDRVLIVDDEDEVREMLGEYLEDNGYVVATARNGSEALDFLDAEPSVAVVLLDVNMPGMGGLATLKELKRRKLEHRVIMISGIGDHEIARHAIEMGAFDYIVKPPDYPMVEASVSACLSAAEFAQKKRRFWW